MWKLLAIMIVVAPAIAGSVGGRQPSATIATGELRITTPLMQNWKFTLDDSLTDRAALKSDGRAWQTVNLPHTWNATDAASLDAVDPYRRGVGWYRLEFPAPAKGERHWLEFGAASLVADVWLNGKVLGRHRGGFTAFRFDITAALSKRATNVLLVKTDNRDPKEESDPTAIDPIGGDYNKSGGLYRHVAMISTVNRVHFSLDDMGGPGVYATTKSIQDGRAHVSVRAKLQSNATQDGNYTVRLSLVDASGNPAAQTESRVKFAAGGRTDVTGELDVAGAHLWQGTDDPYLYTLVAELLEADGTPADRIVQSFGIRQIRFDPNDGVFLNGQPVRLRGVAMHQDYLGKAWAVANEDVDESLALVKEIGANAVRLGHYPFSQYTLQRVSELGLIAWAEKPSGLRTTVKRCTTHPPTKEFMANARQQLQETIRQQFNHAAVALWSVGNETAAGQSGCDKQYDNVTPYLRELHELARQEDPSRPTSLAEFTEGIEGSVGLFGRVSFTSAGITDVLATNRYYLWYNLDLSELGELLDVMRRRYPNQPLGITEYGAGAAITHHTDNPEGGPPEVRSAPEGQVSYQPEEYAAYVHEKNWQVITGKKYLWGTFIWNMFDFGSDHRNEGDVQGVNTKGLVTFDRKTKKDPFFFYKANWSREPVTYITGRRYTERVYPLADVRVYSNADSVQLSVNGKIVGSLNQSECEQKTCIFRDVPLRLGENKLVAAGSHGGKQVTDEVQWSRKTRDVNIAAGRLAAGYTSSQGARFGSDYFYTGGTGAFVERAADAAGGPPKVIGTHDPMLFKYFRRGKFSYKVPLENGSYEVTLGFVEPDKQIPVGGRIFDIAVNGEAMVPKFDVLEKAGGQHSAPVVTSFRVAVSDGQLTLAFTPVQGDAIVSYISIRAK